MMFDSVKMNFGFGCMRLPISGNEVDYAEFSAMVDTFLQNGFNYFDTAHIYLSGKSEIALRECLTKRYLRERYILTDKLTSGFFKTENDIRPFFEMQLAACGVDYFDFYLMHAQNAKLYEKYTACRAYEVAAELKAEGKIRHVGLSFHDKAAVLDQILSEHPEIEAVQIQFNYLDYDDMNIESRLCYEVCLKHSKPIIVMEPVKGGHLANLPKDAESLLNGQSAASYAIRYAASFENVFMTLSGMSNLAQMGENLGFMKNFVPLSKAEIGIAGKINEILHMQNAISCTACRYCVAGCPKKIAIPELFSCLNAKKVYKDWNTDLYYLSHTQYAGKAKDCIECGKCEATCPQHLKVIELLKEVSRVFDRGARNA